MGLTGYRQVSIMSTQAGESTTAMSIIGGLWKELMRMYQQDLSEERARLHQEEFNHGDTSFSPLGRIELFSDYIAGIASSLTEKRRVRKISEDAINNLEHLSVFKSESFSEWFLSSANKYPKLRLYVELTDYLRRLMIDYLKGKSF
jgi:hypothetical protein